MTPVTPESESATPPTHRAPSRGEVLTDRTASIVIYVVTAIWAANILAGMFKLNGYQPSSEINGIFMAVVGGAFLARTRAKGGEEK